MCNCYGHKCELCSTLIPMHIEDFRNDPDEFKCWCEKHVDLAPPGARIHTIVNSDEYDIDRDEGMRKGWCCAILGPDSGTPNLASRTEIRIVTGQGSPILIPGELE